MTFTEQETRELPDLPRPGLFDQHGRLPMDAFFRQVDETGGWPLGYPYVAYHHSDKRECMFMSTQINTGWWTTVCSADDYYWWKVSEAKRTSITADTELHFWNRIGRLITRSPR